MHVVVITPGGHRRVGIGAAEKDMYGIISLLRKMGHRVTLYDINTYKGNEDYLASLEQKYGITVKTFRPDMGRWSDWLLHSLRAPALLDRAAYMFDLLARDEAFNDFLDREDVDVAIPFCSFTWPLFKGIKRRGIWLVFRSHNFEPSFYYESIDLIKKWFPTNWIRYVAKLASEYISVANADIVGSIPFEQVRLYRKWRASGVHVLTLTFLGEHIRGPHFRSGKKVLDVFYLGASYNVSFHRRGVEMLLRDIIPPIQAKAPGSFRFHICGGKLPEKLQALCNGTDVVYEGYVPDLDAFLESMDVGAFPVFTGKSMKGKVFEPISRGFPVVIPTLGKGGYELHHGKEVLIADSAEAFTQEIIRLKDEHLRLSIAKGAHAFALRELSEDSVREVLQTLITRPAHTA
jgi:hypothetical protein